MTPQQKLATARLYALRRAPYMASGLMALVPHEAKDLGTFGVTDKGILLWDPACTDRWAIEQIGAVLIHETWHWLRDHAGRCTAAAADHKLWNWAADGEINDDLSDWDLPDSPVLPSAFGAADGLTAEEYYQKLRNKAGAKGGGSGGDGESRQGWCGSGAGRKLPGEPEGAGTGGRSEGDRRRAQTEVARAIQEAPQHGQGSVPMSLRRWADGQLTPPKVRWQDELAVIARDAVAYRPGAFDYTLSKPSRRQAALGFGDGIPRLHAMHSPVPSVMFIADTSGSMGTQEFIDGLSEADGIFKALGVPVTFMAIDAEVHEVRKVRKWQEIVENLKGGGGTDFRPAFDYISTMREKPDVAVFLTDGMGPAPVAEPTEYKVIWLLVGPHQSHPCEWGKFISVESKGETQ